MKKLYFLFLLLATTPCFALFSTNLPQKIVCNAQQYCTTTDDKYAIPGWVLMTGSGFIKPGTYVFSDARLEGNPNDNFYKQVAFDYKMIDKDGYTYELEYVANNWVVPQHKENYKRHDDFSPLAECNFPNVEDCYVTVLTPQK